MKEPEIVEKDSIDVPLLFYQGIKDIPYLMHHKSGMDLHEFSIIVGTKAVDKLIEDSIIIVNYGNDERFNITKEKTFYKEIREALLDDKVLVSYVEKRTGETERKRQYQIEKLVYTLFDLNYVYTKQIASIEERIKKIPQRAREQARELAMPGEVTAVDEMERDFASYMKLAEYGEREKLKENSRIITHNLENGIKLGMHKENRSIQLQDYPGVKINIAEFTNGLAQRYEVKIPE